MGIADYASQNMIIERFHVTISYLCCKERYTNGRIDNQIRLKMEQG